MSIIEFDKQRFDDLYQKYAGMIFRTAYNFLLNKDDAEDIVQEVFIRYFISNKTLFSLFIIPLFLPCETIKCSCPKYSI